MRSRSHVLPFAAASSPLFLFLVQHFSYLREYGLEKSANSINGLSSVQGIDICRFYAERKGFGFFGSDHREKLGRKIMKPT